MIKSQRGSIITAHACELGKTLLENTNYRILPSRTMFPETYEHPPESIGKNIMPCKTLLIFAICLRCLLSTM